MLMLLVGLRRKLMVVISECCVVADFSFESAMHNPNVSPEAQKEAERKLNEM